MVTATTTTYATVPRLWPGETVVCLGTGPSLTREDVDCCRGRARVIAIKHAIEYAPWADALYGCGGESRYGKWWQTNGPKLGWYEGLRYTLDPLAAEWAQVLRWGAMLGLSQSPDALCLGKNSGYQAINLAVHLGAKRVVLLGYDMAAQKDRDHYFGNHQAGNRVPFGILREVFDSLVEPLKAAGVEIVNATRETALTCFPRQTIAEALA
jgi:hypothetical protein